MANVFRVAWLFLFLSITVFARCDEELRQFSPGWKNRLSARSGKFVDENRWARAGIRRVVQSLLSLRYDVKVVGLDRIRPPGSGEPGLIVGFVNHPSMSDPLLYYSFSDSHLRLRPLMSAGQIQGTGIKRWFLDRVDPIAVANTAVTSADTQALNNATMAEALATLQAGRSIGLHIAGENDRGTYPNFHGVSMFGELAKASPNSRVVLAVMKGMNGSSLGYGESGVLPDFGAAAAARIADLLKSGIFLMPKRKIEIEFVEMTEPPRHSVTAMNRLAEEFFRDHADGNHNVAVPFTPWDARNPRTGEKRVAAIRPDVIAPQLLVPGKLGDIPVEFQREIMNRISEILPDYQRDMGFVDFVHDLDVDSLALTELTLVLSRVREERGVKLDSSPQPVETVEQAILFAWGYDVTKTEAVRAADFRYLAQLSEDVPIPLAYEPGEKTFLDAMKRQTQRNPDRIFLADTRTGYWTYREFSTLVSILRDEVERRSADENYIGILMPKTVVGRAMYWAVLGAGKTPVEINFTAGMEPMKRGLVKLGVKHVLSSREFTEKLAKLDPKSDFSGLGDDLVLIEDIRSRVGKLKFLSRVWRRQFLSETLEMGADMYKNPDVNSKSGAVLLFTSGSEGDPKRVPLAHRNQFRIAQDVVRELRINRRTRVINALPDFHSFGHFLSMAAETSGVPQILSQNPLDGAVIAKQVFFNRATLIALTPKFASLMAKAASEADLHSLEIILLGADKVTADLVRELKSVAPNATILQGYGTTETGPVIAVNRIQDADAFTLGRPLPWVSESGYRVVNREQFEKHQRGELPPEAVQDVPKGEAGVLLVSGAGVFAGYHDYDKRQPFYRLPYLDGERTFYLVGDLIREREDGHWIFCGRLKRNPKVAGEQIPVDKMEEILVEHVNRDGRNGTLAIVYRSQDVDPEFYVFTTDRTLDVAVANGLLKGKVPAVARIAKVIYLDELPMVGSGKVDLPKLEREIGRGE